MDLAVFDGFFEEEEIETGVKKALKSSSSSTYIPRHCPTGSLCLNNFEGMLLTFFLFEDLIQNSTLVLSCFEFFLTP
jgi:hypothetical protein